MSEVGSSEEGEDVVGRVTTKVSKKKSAKHSPAPAPYKFTELDPASVAQDATIPHSKVAASLRWFDRAAKEALKKSMGTQFGRQKHHTKGGAHLIDEQDIGASTRLFLEHRGHAVKRASSTPTHSPTEAHKRKAFKPKERKYTNATTPNNPLDTKVLPHGSQQGVLRQLKRLLFDTGQFSTPEQAWTQAFLPYIHSKGTAQNGINKENMIMALERLGFRGNAKECFEEMDIDSDGYITFRDFKTVLADPVIKQLDVLKTLCITRYGSLPTAWKNVFDEKHMGFVTFADFCKAATTLRFEGDRRAVWKYIDHEKTGRITLKDFDPHTGEMLESFRKMILEKYNSYVRFWQVLDPDDNGSAQEEDLDHACVQLGWTGDVDKLFQHLTKGPHRNYITVHDLCPRAFERDAIPEGTPRLKLQGHWYAREEVSPWFSCSMPQEWIPPEKKKVVKPSVPAGKVCGSLWQEHCKLQDLKVPPDGCIAPPATPTTVEDQVNIQAKLREVAQFNGEVEKLLELWLKEPEKPEDKKEDEEAVDDKTEEKKDEKEGDKKDSDKDKTKQQYDAAKKSEDEKSKEAEGSKSPQERPKYPKVHKATKDLEARQERQQKLAARMAHLEALPPGFEDDEPVVAKRSEKADDAADEEGMMRLMTQLMMRKKGDEQDLEDAKQDEGAKTALLAQEYKRVARKAICTSSEKPQAHILAHDLPPWLAKTEAWQGNILEHEKKTRDKKIEGARKRRTNVTDFKDKAEEKFKEANKRLEVFHAQVARAEAAITAWQAASKSGKLSDGLQLLMLNEAKSSAEVLPEMYEAMIRVDEEVVEAVKEAQEAAVRLKKYQEDTAAKEAAKPDRFRARAKPKQSAEMLKLLELRAKKAAREKLKQDAEEDKEKKEKKEKLEKEADEAAEKAQKAAEGAGLSEHLVTAKAAIGKARAQLLQMKEPALGRAAAFGRLIAGETEDKVITLEEIGSLTGHLTRALEGEAKTVYTRTLLKEGSHQEASKAVEEAQLPSRDKKKAEVPGPGKAAAARSAAASMSTTATTASGRSKSAPPGKPKGKDVVTELHEQAKKLEALTAQDLAFAMALPKKNVDTEEAKSLGKMAGKAAMSRLRLYEVEEEEIIRLSQGIVSKRLAFLQAKAAGDTARAEALLQGGVTKEQAETAAKIAADVASLLAAVGQPLQQQASEVASIASMAALKQGATRAEAAAAWREARTNALLELQADAETRSLAQAAADKAVAEALSDKKIGEAEAAARGTQAKVAILRRYINAAAAGRVAREAALADGKTEDEAERAAKAAEREARTKS
eukprot:TRINITY_DN101202_c0_g1_i1.p1 TRINITY_DN101202_c0_g1~~TRINITY_DN101202_c0_g1_i1.p1  ORF type:complete len:1299 (-),score=417.75 TRINITY_DN101202_c0_g1_i1:63-3959(-)